MIPGLVLLLASALPSSSGREISAEVSIPAIYVSGQPFMVEVVYSGGADGISLEAWRLGPAAFEQDGKPLGKRRSRDPVELPRRSSLTLDIDLSGYLDLRPEFKLELSDAGEDRSRDVLGFGSAPDGVDFMTLEASELSGYQVLLRTNRGDIRLETWPDVAPNHVRNFLDLCSSGFYDGILFHRTSPTFMIQGGCPITKTSNRNAWGTGAGPRRLESEFNEKQHFRGVLSMARGESTNSASSQFFLMTADSFFLDGKYSAFGRLISGLDVIDRIAKAPGRRNPQDGTKRPTEPQRIEKALVLTIPPR